MNDKLDIAEFGRHLAEQIQARKRLEVIWAIPHPTNSSNQMLTVERKKPEPYANNPLYGSI